MGKAQYWQRGDSIDFVNTTDKTLEANTILSVGDHIGVAGTDILPGETGSLFVSGVFEMPKTSTTEIAEGKNIYFDGNGITDTASEEGASPVGYAIQAAKASDPVIYVKLLG